MSLEQQHEASDPRFPAWVEASAGAGKTKILTDRVLRLLLAGVPPERILCLTFTKAAAAESHRMHVMHAMLSVHMHAQRKNDDADVTIIYVSTCLRLILGIYFYPHTIDTRAVFT